MKLRSFYFILASVVGGLLLVATIGFYWLLSQSPLNLLKAGQDVTPAAAMFVPRQAPAMVSLLANPDQLEAFRLGVARPGERRQARAELAQLQQGLLANTGLSYKQDIQPWLGKEITLAVTTLDIDRDAANGRQPGYLLAIATQDPERSREFLQLFWQKRAIAGTDLVFEQYKGVKLLYGSQAEQVRSLDSGAKGKKSSTLQSQLSTLSYSSPSLASAAVGDRFILFANHPKVLRDAINNVQAPDLSLRSASFYEQALETLTKPRIGLSFINLPGLAAWLAEETAVPGKDPTKSATVKPETTPAYQTMAIALELDRRGLVAETALSGGKKSSVAASLTQPVGALQYLPARSALAASGINLDRLWAGLSSDLKSYETASKLLNQPLAELQKRWKIDLPRDVFSWVKGEYALGLVPSSGTQAEQREKKKTNASLSTPPAVGDWIFIAQRSDVGLAKQGIDRLDAIAKEQGLSVGPIKLGDQTVSAWTHLTTEAGKKDSASLALQAEVRGVHATVGNYEVFTSSIASMDRVLRGTDNSLMKDSRFQQAIAPLLQPNNGYLYLDWATSQPILKSQFPLLKLVELTGKPLFDHLRSVTLSSYGSQAGVQRGGMFLQLG
ncbi:DUF3352 domain-containing protein [Leptothermofonsia sp. ETS-13]|uniref:DUF3352 domain-containing protein n=1 Tax=Leptothermofonsia sp. ETS-13 TaxID=3035696 RepID=UPI003BA2B90F